MNHVYGLVFNRARGVLQVTSEHGRSQGGQGSDGGCAVVGSTAGLLSGARRLAVVGLLGGLAAQGAMAACTPTNPAPGATVTCTGVPTLIAVPPVPLINFTSAVDGLTVNVVAGAGLNALLAGTALTLTGNNVTLNNAGRIDPSFLGILGGLTSGVVMGNGNASQITVNNAAGASLYGTSGDIAGVLNLPGLTGMALNIQNGGGAGGITTIVNSGTIAAKGIIPLLELSDAPVVVVQGGSKVSMRNDAAATITGRVAFGAATTGGNSFINAGTINGSVSLGANSANSFTAVTGSSVNRGLGVGAILGVVGIPNLIFAATGVVDGGAGGSNTLLLQNDALTPGSGVTGAGTIASTGYVNFGNLTLNSGTWTLQGPVLQGATTSATLNGGVALFDNAAVFGAGAVTAAGGAIGASLPGLTLANNFTLNGTGLGVQGANGLTLGGVLSGAGSLNMTGAGTLTLNGANTFGGGVNLNATGTGGLRLGNAGALGTGLVTVGLGSIDTAAAMTLANNFNLTGGLTLAGGADLTLSGQLNGVGSLSKTGAANLTLNGVSGYAGGTNLLGGQLTLGIDGAIGTGALNTAAGTQLDASVAVTLPNALNLGGLLTLGGTGAMTLGGPVGGAGGLVKNGAAGLTLSGNNTFGGGVLLNTGALTVGSNTALGVGVLTAAAGTTLDASAAVNLANGVVLSGDLTLGGSADLSLGGNIAGTGGLIKNGAGSLTLSGLNAQLGATSLNTGKLVLGSNTALGLGALNVAGGTTLDASAAVSLGNAVNLAGDLNIGGTAALTLGGKLSGAGGLIKAGAANLVLNGATNDFTGGVQLNAGGITVGAGAALGTGALTAAGGTTLDANAAVSLGNAITLNGDLNIGGTAALTLGGNLNGAGGLIKAGAANLTLNGAANGFTGGVQLNAGALTLGNATALGTGTLTAAGGTTLGTSAALSLTNNITLNGNLNLAGTADLTLDGTLTGGGGLTQLGAATLTLNGANGFTGGTTLNGGALVVGNAGGLGTGALTVGGAASLDVSAPLTLGNGLILNANLTLGGNGQGLTLGGGIVGTGGLIKNGAGSLALNGSSTFTGGTALNAGSLVVGSDTALGLGVLNAAAGTSLDASVAVNLSNGINLGGNLTLGGTANLGLGGPINGVGGLIKNGAADLTLTGPNGYLGDTQLNAGRLVVGGPVGALGLGTLNAAAGTTLDATVNATLLNNINIAGGSLTFGGGADLSLAGNINGAGGLIKNGAANLVLGGTNGYTGNTQINAGTLTVNGSLTNSAVTVGAGGALAGSGTIGGAVNIGAGGQMTLRTGTALSFGSLNFDPNAVLNAQLGAPGLTGLLNVAGNLSLAGTLNVSNIGGFGNGVYRLINYGGTLSGPGLTLGTLPGGITPGDLTVQTAVGSQVNLVVAAANASVQFWNGVQLVPTGTILGGPGVWAPLTTNWTDANGSASTPWADGFAVFGGAAGGLVTLGTPMSFTGAQFTVNGYNIAAPLLGGLVAVNDGTGVTALRVDPGISATISAPISGAGNIVKRDTGTLILGGTNTYTGGTTIEGGILSVAADANLGAASGGLTLNGGTLQVTGTAFNSTTRGITLGSNGGGFDIAAAGNTFTVSQALGGTGALIKDGAGTLVLSGANNYSGGTAINAGTLQGDTTSLQGNIVNNAALVFDQAATGTYGGALSGSGSVTKNGTGTVTLSGTNNTYAGGTTISAGTLAGGAGSFGSGGITNNATLQLDQATTGTLANAISGTGAVIKTGAGTLVLGGANNYSGGTTISAGTLQGNTTSLQGNIVNNAALVFDQGGAGTFAGVVSGGGSVGKIGAGTLTLSGVNTYAGGTTISAGTLVGSATSFGSGAIVDNAALVIDQPTNASLANPISGTGSLTKDGAGTLVLSGPNSYSGGTTVNAGTLQGDTTSLQGNIANNAALVFDQGGTGTLAGAISGTGTLTKIGAGTLTLAGNNSFSGGTTISAGTLVGSATSFGSGAIVDNAALVLDQPGAGTLANPISGTGTIVKAGAGALNLTGNSGAFTGTTEVNAGTLVVDGTLGGSLAVNSGASLKANGTVGSTTIRSGGSIAPGNPGGTVNVNGNLTLEAGSNYQVAATPDGRADRIHVAQVANLQGGSVMVVAVNGNWNPTTTYNILNADGGITGQFGGVSANFAFLKPSLSYDANNVTLKLERNAVNFATVAATPNQTAVANAVQQLALFGGAAGLNPLYNAVVQLDPIGAQLAFGQLTGEIHASVQTGLIEDTRFVREAGIDRLRQSQCGVGAPSDLTLRQDQPPQQRELRRDRNECAGANSLDDTRNSVAWGRIYGSWGDIRGNANAARLDRSGSGILVGADTRVAQDWRVGVMGGYGRSSNHLDTSQRDSASIDSYHLGAYGGRQWGALGLRLGAAYGWHRIETQRRVVFTGVADSLNAKYNARTLQLFGELGWRIDTGSVALEPFANLAHVRLSTDSFNERFGISALTGRGDRSNTTFTTLGLRASTTFDIGSTEATARGMLGWRHAFGDITPAARLSFGGLSDFTTSGVPLAKNAAVLEAGLDFHVRRDLTLGVSYNGQFGGGTKDQGLRANLLWKF